MLMAKGGNLGVVPGRGDVFNEYHDIIHRWDTYDYMVRFEWPKKHQEPSPVVDKLNPIIYPLPRQECIS
jgi:hypothetical protein